MFTQNNNSNSSNRSLATTTSSASTSPVNGPSATPHGIQDILSRPTPFGPVTSNSSPHQAPISSHSGVTSQAMMTPVGSHPMTSPSSAASSLSALGAALQPRFSFAGTQGMYFNPAAAAAAAASTGLHKLAAGLAGDLSGRGAQFYWPQMVQNQAIWRDRLSNAGNEHLVPSSSSSSCPVPADQFTSTPSAASCLLPFVLRCCRMHTV